MDRKDNASARRRSTPEEREEKVHFGRVDVDDEPDVIEQRSMARTLSAGGTTPASFGARAFHLPADNLPTTFGAAKKAEATPSYGQRTDTSNYVSASPRDLPPSPFRLEKHTHFHVKAESVGRIGTLIGHKLCELDTDFTFDASKCKWKVDYRRGLQRVNFHIVLFRAKKEFALEVQRREGDVTALMHIYGELKLFFKRSLLLSEKSTIAGVKRPAPKPAMPVQKASALQGVEPVKSLLTASTIDTQVQGVLGAISLASQVDSKADLASLVPILVRLATQRPASPVNKLVGVALGNLCEDASCRDAFIKSDGWQFVVKFAAGEDVDPEAQRECLHVVSALCGQYASELAQADGAAEVLSMVRGWQSIQDPRLKKHAFATHRELQAAGVLA